MLVRLMLELVRYGFLRLLHRLLDVPLMLRVLDPTRADTSCSQRKLGITKPSNTLTTGTPIRHSTPGRERSKPAELVTPRMALSLSRTRGKAFFYALWDSSADYLCFSCVDPDMLSHLISTIASFTRRAGCIAARQNAWSPPGVGCKYGIVTRVLTARASDSVLPMHLCLAGSAAFSSTACLTSFPV